MTERRPRVRPSWSASPFGSLVRRFTFMIGLTNVCNLRCKMCGIWSERPNIQPPLEGYRDLLRQPMMRRARVIALTGGEPFALDDFGEYVGLARQLAPRAHVNISTNGWYTDRTMKLLVDADTPPMHSDVAEASASGRAKRGSAPR
ncbi:MAG: radical SAM protein [Deltaproteobacteria bacterium]|nr:radical SAM protein [Deltaproteobacteria bacterium]MBW2363412.1 radical SAM protein [Deltaproteobacteria bacterium]